MIKLQFQRCVGCVLIGAGLLFLNGCTSGSDSVAEAPTEAASEAEQTTPAELQTVRFTLSWMFQGVDAPLTVAMENGYFAEQGLEVVFERGYGSADSVTKVAAGQYDIGEGDMYSMIEFNERNPDTPLIAVAIKYNRSPFAVVSLKETGIESPEMLTGKQMAAPSGDAVRRLWPVFASNTGLSSDSVEWTNVEPQLRESLLAQKRFDAITCFTISCLPPLQEIGVDMDDLNVFYYTEHGLDLYGNALIVRKDFLEANPEVVEGFVRAYVKGIQTMLADPDAAFATMPPYAEDGLFDRDLERGRLQLALDTLYTSPEVEQYGVGGIVAERLDETIGQVVEGFGLETRPSVEEVFDGRFLPPVEERTLLN